MNNRHSTTRRRFTHLILLTLFGLTTSFPLLAAVIDESIEIHGTYFFNEVYSTNRFFEVDKPLAKIGALVTPSPDTDRWSTNPTDFGDETTVSISHENLPGTSFDLPYRGPIFDPEAGIINGSGFPNEYFGANFLSTFVDNNALSGWTISASNPNINSGAAVTAVTPDLDPALTPGHVTNVAISGASETPTLSWKHPDDSIHNAQTVFIWRTDLADENGDLRPPVLVHAVELASSTSSSFTVPEDLSGNVLGNETLDPNGQYLLSIQLEVREDPLGDFFSIQGRSSSFFEFTPTAATPGGPTVFLPAVDEEGVFHFFVDVVEGEQVYIDPIVAVGYDYEVGIGDPLFASFMLPEIGDDLFDLFLFDMVLNDFIFDQVVQAGVQFFFTDPVSRFRILGIETDAALDPSDPTAFITALTFDGNGSFTGTMTPITESVPEPGSIGLFALGLTALRVWRRKRLTTNHSQSSLLTVT